MKMWELTFVQKYEIFPFFWGLFLNLSSCLLFSFNVTLLQARDTPGHVQTFIGSQGPPCKSACTYDPLAGRSPHPNQPFPVRVRSRSRHLPLPCVCWPLTHGDGPWDKWLQPFPWEVLLAEGWVEGYLLSCVVSWRQGRLLPCPSLRPCWAHISNLDSSCTHAQAHARGAEQK